MGVPRLQVDDIIMAFQDQLASCGRNVFGRFGVELFVIFLVAFQCLGFIGTYIISVAMHDVSPGLPYISDTGGKPPESCVFTFICCISGIVGFVIVYIRYQHVHQFYRTLVIRLSGTNTVAFVFGTASLFGLIMVGSFQDDTVATAHFIGAMFVFVGGVVYMWLQTLISYRIYHASLTRHHGSVIIALRLLIALLASVFLVVAVSTGVTAQHELHHDENSGGGTSFWKPVDGGFPYHIVSTVSEWALGLSFLLFFLTFHVEFMKIGVTVSITFRSDGSGQIQENAPLLL